MAVTPLPAASVLLLQDAPLRVLLLRRHANASFMPNVWVFPGGTTDAGDASLGDGSTLSTMRVTAARETFEETGIWLGEPLADAEAKRRALIAGELAFGELLRQAPIDFERLVPTSRWITPVGIPKRFDTCFFLARAPLDAVAAADELEIVEAQWAEPRAALGGKLAMVLPTVKNLEAIAAFDSVDALLASRRGAVIEPIQPILVNGKPTLP